MGRWALRWTRARHDIAKENNTDNEVMLNFIEEGGNACREEVLWTTAEANKSGGASFRTLQRLVLPQDGNVRKCYVLAQQMVLSNRFPPCTVSTYWLAW